MRYIYILPTLLPSIPKHSTIWNRAYRLAALMKAMIMGVYSQLTVLSISSLVR